MKAASTPAQTPLGPLLSLVGTMIVWGFVATGIKLLLPYFSLDALNGWRLLMASGLFILTLLILRSWPRLTPRQYLHIGLVSFLGTTAFQITFVNGVANSPAGLATLVSSVNPVWVALFGLVAGERLSGLRWLGIGLSVLGMGLMSLKTLDASSGVTLVRLAWLLSSNLVWALYTVLQRPLLRFVSPLQFNGLGYALGSLPYLIFGFPAMLEATTQPIPAAAWLGLAAVGILGQYLGFVGFSRGVQAVGPTRAAVFLNLIPIVGLTVAFLVLGEPITWLTVLATAVTLAGVSLANSR